MATQAEPQHPVPVEELGTILTIWAHPDDETYLAGGLMAAAVDAGQRVVCASATSGERGTDDPRRWPPERLGAVRRMEASAAMAVLGVTEHRLFGLPDGGLSTCDAEGIRLVGQLVDEVQPDTLVTFGPDGATFHPDHLAVHRWVTEVWTRDGATCRLLYTASSAEWLERFEPAFSGIGAYMTEERPVGVAPADLALDLRLSGAALDRKLTALRAMATQTAPVMAALGLDTFEAAAARESFVDAPAPIRSAP